MRLLFSDLPPELCNAIYAEVIDHSVLATSAGLPFALKTYDCGHTRTTITPVHHGNTSLLALRKYQFKEATEYFTYLLANDVELQISIEFTGHMHAFVQQHWDAKITAHFQKLLRKYQWLAKVKRWDVKVFWNPPISFNAKAKPTAVAQIVNGMVATISSFQDAVVRRKAGFWKVALHVDKIMACAQWHQGSKLTLGGFLTATCDAKQQERAIYLDVEEEKAPVRVGNGLIDIPGLNRTEEKHALLLMRTLLKDGKHCWETLEKNEEKDHMWILNVMRDKLIEECVGIGDVSIVDA